MFIYWSMYIAPLLGGFVPSKVDRTTGMIVAWLVGVSVLLIVGLRDEVGCDWEPYLDHFLAMQTHTLLTAPTQTDSGYALLNYVVYQLGFGIHVVNAVCAAILAVGLLAFVRRQPLPWLALCASIPMLVIITGMTLTRQATAIGLLMLAFNAFNDRRLLRFIIFVALAASFHKTAVAMAPLAIFIQRRGTLTPLVLGGTVTGILAMLFLVGSLDRYAFLYIERFNESSDVIYRASLNLAAALAFFMFRKRWMAKYDDGKLYTLLALVPVIVAPFMFNFPVAVDRSSLYLLPFQFAVFARLPTLIEAPVLRAAAVLAVAGAYAVLLHIWFTFAGHAFCYLPYQSILF